MIDTSTFINTNAFKDGCTVHVSMDAGKRLDFGITNGCVTIADTKAGFSATIGTQEFQKALFNIAEILGKVLKANEEAENVELK